MLRKFFAEESGMETVEYAVMGALVIAVTVATITALGAAVKARFEALTAAVG